LKGQVVHFLGVALQIEKLNVIVPENFLQRLWRVESVRRVVARELVTSIGGTISVTSPRSLHNEAMNRPARTI
jgi:hypothetical protein